MPKPTALEARSVTAEESPARRVGEADDGRNPQKSRYRSLLILGCLLTVCSALYLQQIGSSYITLWDEAIQVNVVQNLAEHCCLPYLHRSPAIASLGGDPARNGATTEASVSRHVQPGTDFRNWANNTVWLHKPLLSFYVAAATFRLGGHTLWGLRLSGAIFALLNAVVIYQIGRKFLSNTVGLCAVAIFALTPYTNQLVHGQAFVGFPDLALCCGVSAAMYFVLHWSRYHSPSALRWLGVAVAVAYMCKGGLALGPFAVLVIITVLAGRYRDFLPMLQSFAIFAALVTAEQFYWRIHYPQQLRYESHEQILHLVQSVEGWGAPWSEYLVGYVPAILTLPLIPVAYFSVLWAVSRFKAVDVEFVLGIWVLTYFVTLSFAVSKVENHIFSILPAFALLIPCLVERFIRQRHFDVVLAFCLAALAIVVITRAGWKFRHPGVFALLAAALIVLSVLCRLLPWWQSKSAILTISILTSTALILLLLNIRQAASDNTTQPADSAAQARLRQAALIVRPVVDRNGLILAHTRSTDFSYLYLMYWSGVDVLDLCREPDPPSAMSVLRNANGLYLITQQQLPGNILAKTPIGDLYNLKDVPYQDWSKAAAAECRAQ